jgi:hypothetical protein
MIERFVNKFDKIRDQLKAKFSEEHPSNYEGIFRTLITELVGEEEYSYGAEWPDPDRIHTIDEGDYQGTMLFVVAAQGYQPSTYFACTVSYGSCSGCDTFEALREYGNEKPTEDQVEGYFTLALHMLQEMVEIS